MGFDSIRRELAEKFPEACQEHCPVVFALADEDIGSILQKQAAMSRKHPKITSEEYAISLGDLAHALKCRGPQEELHVIEDDLLIMGVCGMRAHFLQLAGAMSKISRLKQEIEIPKELPEDFK